MGKTTTTVPFGSYILKYYTVYCTVYPNSFVFYSFFHSNNSKMVFSKLFAASIIINTATGAGIYNKTLSKNSNTTKAALDDICSVIADDLPSECQCQNGQK